MESVRLEMNFPSFIASIDHLPSSQLMIAVPSVMEQRVVMLRNAGVKVEYRKYRNVGHGFAIGLNTIAED